MRPILRSLECLLMAAAVASAQIPDSATPLPADPAVIRGRFENGVQYFIRRNEKPERRAEFRLVVNAGSILEDDAQRGIAHFVEHMAFNGTRRFPKSAIVDFLERAGMRFGADVNAYTSFDETVYMLQVPTDTAQLVLTALDILADWAHDLSFASAEMKKERAVVIEEWRTGRGAQERVQDRQLPVLLKGSRYAARIPIGTRENLESFPDSLALQFYRDWYRPDLLTVVAVGDFDPAVMRSRLRERFEHIAAPSDPRPRTYAPVPDHDRTLVSIETDPEYPVSLVALSWKKPSDSTRTVGDFRRQLVETFYDGMMNERLSELARKPDAPFAAAYTGRGPLVRTLDLYQLAGLVKENGFEKAVGALLLEAERVTRFGFTATELERQRSNTLRTLEQQYAERDKTSSARLAAEYVGSALTAAPLLSAEQALELTRALAPAVTLAELNALARQSFSTRNRVVTVVAPAKPDVAVPDSGAMLAVLERQSSEALLAYVDSTSDAPLVAQEPLPGRIVGERQLPETGILEWRLSNGARVLLRPTDFRADEVLFLARSPGGVSLVPDADVVDAELSSVVAELGGVGAFNATGLEKKLAGTKADVGASVGDFAERMSGQASAKDLATLFRLVWLRFTQPRADTSAWTAFRNQMRAFLVNQGNSPERAFDDTITTTMTRHHPRVKLQRPELFDSVDPGRAIAIYRERFADADDFTFFVVGSFVPDSVRPLVERYLAALPSSAGAERARDVGIRPPTGVVERTVRKGVEPKAQTRLVFTGPCAYSWEQRHALASLTELLGIRLREVLREEKGGTYGAGVSGSCSRTPYERYTLAVTFGSAPERVNELSAAVFAVIDEIRAGTVSDSNVAKIREIQLRAHETGLKQNGSWLAAMADADADGRDQREFLRYPELVRRLSKDRLRNAALTFLRADQYARFTLLPEGSTRAEPAKPPDP